MALAHVSIPADKRRRSPPRVSRRPIALPAFTPRNLDRYPRLDTVLMVEKAVYAARSDLTTTQIWRQLPKKVLWTTFVTIIDYLEYSGKILVEEDKTITWIWDPEGIAELKKKGLRFL